MVYFARIPCFVDNSSPIAREFNLLFARAFLLFHRREQRNEPSLTPQSRMLLLHLSISGPLTIGEIAVHIDRSQSVVSETVEALEKRDFLARVRDPRDRRRTLVWLTDAAINYLARSQDVLDTDRLATAFSKLSDSEREQLLFLFQKLLNSVESLARTTKQKEETHE